ncbi:MAG TPA: hypothetical protein VK327_01045 [Candidatus Paceibacterota bacterium]|nr:hypothetical protein [Candidatus Paceibacterota bacterium]
MPFLIYKQSTAGNGIRYERWKPLKLSGKDGIIARHVKTLRGDEPQSWKLGVPEVLALAGAGADAGGFTVLFEVSGEDATSVCLYELIRIHGSCRDSSTQLALDFQVVVDQEIDGDAADYAKAFEVSPPSRPKKLGETLALTGGPGGGDWKWGKPAMNLGATVVQGHGHHNGPPCASCTCGRKP